MNDEIIKCLKCDQVLISCRGAIALFGTGVSVACIKCGNKHIFKKLSRLQNVTD